MIKVSEGVGRKRKVTREREGGRDRGTKSEEELDMMQGKEENSEWDRERERGREGERERG